MSARNRELLALLPVALLVTAGLTAVFIVRSNQIGDLSLTYGAYFLGVCLAVHMVIRLRLPYADPYLFPLVALLAAFGLVILFRIDEELALKQASLMLLGLGLFAATLVLLRDYHVLERYRYLIALVGIGLLLLPRLPGIGEQINGAYLGIKVGPLSVPARRVREDLHRHLPRQLPAREARGADRRREAGGSGSPFLRSSTSGRCSSSGARRC